MKHLLLLSFLLFSLITNVNAQVEIPTLNELGYEIYKRTYFGNIEYINETYHNPIINGDSIIPGNLKRIESRKLYCFDSLQNIIEIHIYDRDYDQHSTLYKFEYNDKGQKSSWSDNHQQYLKYIHYFFYDGKGRLIKDQTNNSTKEILWSQEYTYDYQNFIKESLKYRNNRTIDFSGSSVYSYKVIEPEKYIIQYFHDPKSDTVTSYQIIKYNEDKKLIEQTHSINETIYQQVKYKYDQFGNVTEIKLNNHDPTIYTYIYDNKNNWIQRTNIGTNEVLNEVIVREIKYYE